MGKRSDGESGGTEEAGSEGRALGLGRRARTLVGWSARGLATTWALVFLAALLGPLLGFPGRAGFLPIMAVAWLGFPLSILLGLGGQVLDLVGVVAWKLRARESGYFQATGRGGDLRWALGYPAFLLAFWALIPLELFCCFPVVC